MAHKLGDTVRLIQPVIEGQVKGAAVNDDATLLLLVEYIDEHGQLQARYFKKEQLESVIPAGA